MAARFSWSVPSIAAACFLTAGEAALAQGATQPAAASPAAAESAAEPEQRFTVDAYDVIGNSVLDQTEIERAVYPYLGPERTVDDVNKAREALENVYRARGYQSVSVGVLGTAPDDDTVVQLQVTEARIGELKVAGNRYFSGREILAQVPALREGEVPNLVQAQAQLSRLDRNADRRVTPQVALGTQPGTIDVTLEVEDDLPLHASVTLSNDHSPNTSELRLLTSIRSTDLWGLGHNFSFSYLVAPERRDDAEVFAGSYLIPIYNSPWSILFFGYRSNSDVALLGGANVLGNGYAIGTRGVLTLPNAGRWAQSVNFGVDYKDFAEDTLVPDATPIPAPVRYIPFTASYSTQRVGDRSRLALTASVTAGLRAFKDTVRVEAGNDDFRDEPAFENRRVGARENFVHANVEAEWERNLTDDTILIGRFAGQYTDGPLVSNEQFSIGGTTSVRGYLQSEAVGDDGVSGQFEVQLPSIAPAIGKQVQNLRGYVFVDAGFTRNRELFDPGQDNDFTLLSLGAGARAQVFRFLSGDVLLGVPLLDGVSTGVGGPNVYFSVKGEF